jgi:hypothetical protein
MILIGIMAGITSIVLIVNFSTYKKDEKYKLPLNGFFLFFMSFLFMIEIAMLFLAPKGYFDFGTARSIIIGSEVALGIGLGFIKKLELL